MRHNINTSIGIIGGLVLFVTAILLTSKTPLLYLNVHGAMIVIGGTLAATLISFSFEQLKATFARVGRLFRPDHLVEKGDLEHFVHIAAAWHAGKISHLEDEIKRTASPFVRTGLQLIADGMAPEQIVSVLETRMKHQEILERNDSNVLRTMATYTPAFGLSATLIGLVNMLFLMGQGATPQQVGINMSLALVATFYGVVLANGVLRPLATKIELKTQERMRVMATIVEALHCIALGRGPAHVREVLYAIAASYADEIGKRDALGAMSESDLYRGKA